MIDTAKVLYNYLTELGNPVRTLIGENCWTLQNEPVGWNNGSAAIAMQISEAGMYSHPEWVEASVTFFFYGGTDNASDCYNIYAAVYDRLHGKQSQQTANGTIEWAQQISSDPDDIEPDSSYRRARATYQIQFKEN
jgi:hypothetical protein